MTKPYGTFSWQSAQVAGDDGYVDEIVALIRAIASLDGDAVSRARAAVGARRLPMQPVDERQLPAEIATNGLSTKSPRRASIVATFERDRYRCRYCRTRVFAPRVLELVSHVGKQLGNALPKHRAWKFEETDPVFYWQFATIEHLVPVSRGGDAHADSNLRTACWPCQTWKSNYLLEELGWCEHDSLADDWTGLRELVPVLRGLARKTPSEPEPLATVAVAMPVSTKDAVR